MPRSRLFSRQASSGSTRLVPRAEMAMRNPTGYLAKSSSAALTKIEDSEPATRKGHEWQKDAFTYNELIAEVGFLHNLTAELVASCELRVAEDTYDEEEHTFTEVESQDPRCLRVMRAFVGPVGGQKELKRRAALHYQVAGESLLVGSRLRNPDGEDQGTSWEFLSTEEVKSKQQNDPGNPGKKITVYERHSGGQESVDGEIKDASVARFYRPDPRFSGRADSPMKRILPIARELVILSEVVDAVAKSRLSAGLLLVPEELTFGPDNEDTTEEGTTEEDIDVFLKDLISHLKAPVEDRTSAASLVPLLMKGPAEFLKEIRLVDLSRALDEQYQGLRNELLKRIGNGLDAPPEIIQGKANLNHWSAYSVDTDFVDKHVSPIGEALAEFLTVAYLRPMLVRYEDIPENEVHRFKLIFDARALARQADEAASATSGVNLNIISDVAWAIKNGFQESDIATDNEKKRRLLEKLVMSAPGIFGPAILPLLYPKDDKLNTALDAVRKLQPGMGAPIGGWPSNEGTPDPGDPSSGAPVDGPPDVVRKASTDPRQAPLDALVDRLATAADLALDRAMERAGSRVLSKMGTGHPILRDQFKNVPKTEILQRMKDIDFRTLNVSIQDLMGDAWDSLVLKGRGWTRDWAISAGLPSVTADEVATATMREVARAMEVAFQAAVNGNLSMGRNGLRIPDNLVLDCITEAMSVYGTVAA